MKNSSFNLRIYCMHGVVENKKGDPADFNQRIFFDAGEFEEYLKKRPVKFTDIDKAVTAGKGDVLTIDDARIGGLDAALLAAKYEHHANLFINPYYIENERPYYFSYLNYLLQEMPDTTVTLDGEKFPVREINDKYRLRQSLLPQLRQLKTETARLNLLQGLARQLDINLTMENLPGCARTISKEQLIQVAKNPYIKIENHGWTHTCIATLNDAELKQEVQQSKDWIEDTCLRRPNYYVIPFGDRIPPPSCTLPVQLFLLEDPRFHQGFLGKRFYNRFTLQV